ncbi:MAG: 3'(2'),5'-bisphosphate nucleotidase [Phycisphaeraceae bacterium]
MNLQWMRAWQVAMEAVTLAARATRAVQAELITSDTLEKKDRSPVTVADFASQAVVCEALAGWFPNDPVVAEEDADALRESANAVLRDAVVRHVQTAQPRAAAASQRQVLSWIDHGNMLEPNAQRSPARFWTLDPIDGTKGFLRGGQYAIALGLVENGKVVLGALACPSLAHPGGRHPGTLLMAARDEGTWMYPLPSPAQGDALPARVDGLDDPAQARFCESVESGHSDQDQSAQIAGRLGITADPVRMDSQAKYAAVARGDASIYLRLPTRADYREAIWDHAAGAIVIEEAGGRVTDIVGAPLDFSRGKRLERNRGVVATNGAVHDAVIKAIQN